MAIVASNVSKRFGDFAALDDVTVEVPDGSLTALLGPSGSGKSTLLRVIGGLDRPDSGTIEIGGVDVTKLPAHKRGIGFVFQHYAAFKHMTVRKNVAFGLDIRKRPKAETRKRVDDLLELVQLYGFADRYPAQLSGGQRQRMALARALAIEPEVLLLDEPFGALDANVRKDLRAWLRRLHDEMHVTTVFVTHDQEEAMEVSDRIVIVNHGKVEQVGRPPRAVRHARQRLRDGLRRPGDPARRHADPSARHRDPAGAERHHPRGHDRLTSRGSGSRCGSTSTLEPTARRRRCRSPAKSRGCSTSTPGKSVYVRPRPAAPQMRRSRPTRPEPTTPRPALEPLGLDTARMDGSRPSAPAAASSRARSCSRWSNRVVVGGVRRAAADLTVTPTTREADRGGPGGTQVAPASGGRDRLQASHRAGRRLDREQAGE